MIDIMSYKEFECLQKASNRLPNALMMTKELNVCMCLILGGYLSFMERTQDITTLRQFNKCHKPLDTGGILCHYNRVIKRNSLLCQPVPIGLELKDETCSVCLSPLGWPPEWLGKKLVENYNTRESVAELIDGGDMSVCLDEDGTNPEYYNQKGESMMNAPRLDKSLGYYCDKDNGEEYHYLYRLDGYWMCVDQHQWDGTDKDPEVVAIA